MMYEETIEAKENKKHEMNSKIIRKCKDYTPKKCRFLFWKWNGNCTKAETCRWSERKVHLDPDFGGGGADYSYHCNGLLDKNRKKR